MKTQKCTTLRAQPVAPQTESRDGETNGAASSGKQSRSNRVLLDERPLVLLPSLAKAVGVNGAVVIQQLHFYLADPHNGRVIDGQRWIFNSYEDWQKHDFPFWSRRTIQRVFLELETKKLIVTCQPEGPLSRRKYYRVNYGALEKAVRASHTRARERAKLASSNVPKATLPLTESTLQRLPREARVASDVSDVTVTRVTRFSPKIPYPKSEEELCATLEALGIDIDLDHDGYFFAEMEARNWTLPNGKPVCDWPKLYQARLEKIYADMGHPTTN